MRDAPLEALLWFDEGDETGPMAEAYREVVRRDPPDRETRSRWEYVATVDGMEWVEVERTDAPVEEGEQ